MDYWGCSRETSYLDAKIALQDLRRCPNFPRWSLVRNMSIVDDIDALRERESRRKILLH
jgi:hypothetical protein